MGEGRVGTTHKKRNRYEQFMSAKHEAARLEMSTLTKRAIGEMLDPMLAWAEKHAAGATTLRQSQIIKGSSSPETLCKNYLGDLSFERGSDVGFLRWIMTTGREVA